MNSYTMALFGETEKGEYRTPYFFNSLERMQQCVGNPPKNSCGLYYAIQALLFHCNLLFFRVAEEGFSVDDYFYGLQLLHQQEQIPKFSALCIPGVGDPYIIKATMPLCMRYHSILIMNEADLYDYLYHGPLV